MTTLKTKLGLRTILRMSLFLTLFATLVGCEDDPDDVYDERETTTATAGTVAPAPPTTAEQ